MGQSNSLGDIGRRALIAALAALAILFATGQAGAAAQTEQDRYQQLFPEASRFGPAEGAPPAVAAYAGEKLLGYIFSTRQAIESVGYSGKPLDILAGLDLEARLTGAILVAHQEPILMIGVSDADLDAFVAEFRGLDIRNPVRISRHAPGKGEIAAVSGATISSTVFNDAIIRAARAVAKSRGLLEQTGGTSQFDAYAPATWLELLADGSLVRLKVTVGEAVAGLAELGAALPQNEAQAEAGATFIEFYAGLATPARVGGNLLGRRTYERLLAQLPAGDHLLFIAGQGLHSFKGTAFVRDGWFDRIQLVQRSRTFRLHKDDYVLLQNVEIADAPALREYAIFKLHAADGFDPAADWRLQLSVGGLRADGSETRLPVELEYRLPAVYHNREAGNTMAVIDNSEPPLWEQIWRGRIADIVILVVALTVLTIILVFQDFIAHRKKLYEGLRIGFLTFTLIWIGWLSAAQLSVVNVLTFANSLLTDFRWDFFLLEPLIFILWGYVAVVLLFWGRGVFCGWLCPFGALQELSNKLAQFLRLPQWRVPFVLHERLWPIKYILFLGIFALFLGNADLSLKMAEVEPFKTAIVLHFLRGWPFVLYALALIAAGLFVNRFYCRYLCPLGAALAIPARLRMFEWLKRRWHCGNPCQQCAVSCPVQAIHPT
ncbi:MAG TPA: 4Fe-4S binding protein, partial [Dongiaceae bacterium]